MVKSKSKPAKKPQAFQTEGIGMLEISSLRRDGGLQMRCALQAKHVERLKAAYACASPKVKVPEIGVLFDGRDYWVWDGHHRIEAALALGRKQIACRIEEGTLRDALLRACGANESHGLIRSNADKRKAVRMLIEDAEWSKRTTRWIAEVCDVSHTFAATVRRDVEAERKASQAQLATLPTDDGRQTPKEVLDSVGAPTVREGKDGKTYQASKPKSAPAATVDLPDELRRAVRNTAAADDPKQMARLARLAKQDPPLAETVANMLRDGEVATVEEALLESDSPEPEPQEQASAVLRRLLEHTKTTWRVECPHGASPALGAAVLTQVSDEWLSGGWF